MTTDFHRAKRGLEIVTNPASYVQLLTGTSAPDTQPDAIVARVGALWIVNGGNVVTTQVYQKYRIVANDSTDWRNINAFVDSSWREPATVVDSSVWANIASVEAELNDIGTPGNIGGLSSNLFINGDRILLTNLTVGDNNVYIVNGTPGSGATLVEDTNLATAGDVVYIIEGTGAGSLWSYNGVTWVTSGSGSATEEADIRAFIGKDAIGAETPNYNTPTGGGPYTVGNIIGTNDNLELATAKLNAFTYQNNAEIKGTNVTSTTDTLPAGVNLARWLIRVNSNATPTRVRAREVFAIRDNANNVDFSTSNLLNLGAAITGLSFNVTSAGTALTLTITASVAFDYEIKRLAAVGP